jgi:haloalkane dehalogenase
MPNVESFETLQQIPVLDSFVAYRELGSGTPIVLLHGNPTSSFVWRNIAPRLATRGHVFAVDLIGMGHSGKPDIEYRFADHVRYLDAWLDALGLRQVILVGYDWGGALAIDWAKRHAERVVGLAVFETFLKPMHWHDFPPAGRKLFQALRTPGEGEQLVLEENAFLESSLVHGVQTGLSAAARDEYFSAFVDPKSRRPMLQWPREIPIDGQPADVQVIVESNAQWLTQSPQVAKLLLTFDAHRLSNAPAIVEWARNAVPHLDVVPLGAAGHHAPEDAPEAIAEAIWSWLDRERLGAHEVTY